MKHYKDNLNKRLRIPVLPKAQIKQHCQVHTYDHYFTFIEVTGGNRIAKGSKIQMFKIYVSTEFLIINVSALSDE